MLYVPLHQVSLQNSDGTRAQKKHGMLICGIWRGALKESYQIITYIVCRITENPVPYDDKTLGCVFFQYCQNSQCQYLYFVLPDMNTGSNCTTVAREDINTNLYSLVTSATWIYDLHLTDSTKSIFAWRSQASWLFSMHHSNAFDKGKKLIDGQVATYPLFHHL